MQIHTQKNQKEMKKHGNYEFPVHVSPESIKSYEQGCFLWHWHPEIELTWIMTGQMEYYVNDKKYILHAKEGLFCNSNALHSGHTIDGQDCQYLSVTFHPRFLYGYESSILKTKYVDPVTSNEMWHSLKLQKDIREHQDIIGQIQKIGQISGQPPVDYELQVHFILCSIWQKLYSYYTALDAGKQQPPKHLDRLRDMITYLQDHYTQDISLDDVADHVNICKSECCRFFKKYMRMTIIEYIQFYRIQKSLPLLLNGENITRIAGMVGFSSPAYYGQIFKRYMGCPPSQYGKYK